MFAIRQRRRSPRSSRFVPVVDGLTPRIVPVCVAPLGYPPLVESEPAPTTATPTIQLNEADCEAMADMLLELQEECESTLADV